MQKGKRVRAKRAKGKRREKRRKLTRLTAEEKGDLKALKAWQDEIAERSRPKQKHPSLRGRGFEARNIDMVDRVHRRPVEGGPRTLAHDYWDTRPGDIKKDILELRNQFPDKPIRILSEGSGKGTAMSELALWAEKRGIPVDIEATDLDPNMPFAVHASPEELKEKFGPESFHYVESTYGGLNYTIFDQKKGLANIASILKPGGMASVATIDSPEYFTGARRITPQKAQSALKHWKGIEHEHFTYRSYIGPRVTVLRIRKRLR